MTWTIPADPRFTETEFVVDATSAEAFLLWERWSDVYRVPWTDESRGMHTQIGTVDGRPICVSVSWAFIATKRVAFVDGVSQLVDYRMVDNWQRATFPCLAKHGRHSDVTNFGHVISGIRDMVGFDIVRRSFDEVERLLGGVR